ncbi:tRNA N6-adenosine threonylcarbamoyltransferase, mitochondrial-like [Topomyia yanbarensis]|uniref:tRNA N6-adenosine threonylcarbamoyltransferase, mitochondrial-like n=1 Tax=Topomyia yanbarensis TaxID=2498891 RepID=UPI00273CD6BE|nr:tRNA N6-adenosine threonylcarbamoyltransferase, mitochondrial-like [Topomyia yanbarensis]
MIKLSRLAMCRKSIQRLCHNEAQRPYVLGIETSCDDSGAAIVSSDGQILSEYINSQQNSHLRSSSNHADTHHRTPATEYQGHHGQQQNAVIMGQQ